jgi:8-amino-7-oxononanoate synthase
LGGEEEALSCATHLERKGILAVAIRPPTVPIGGSRLRISLQRLHTDEHLAELISALTEWRSAGRG